MGGKGSLVSVVTMGALGMREEGCDGCVTPEEVGSHIPESHTVFEINLPSLRIIFEKLNIQNSMSQKKI